MAAKKPTKKKDDSTPPIEEVQEPVPQKANPKLATVDSSRFDIFSAKSQKKTRDLLANIGLADGFKTASEINRTYLPAPHMAIQYLFHRIGIPAKSIIEFIGQEGIGKSSLVFNILGTFVRNNIPCMYVNCEPKMLEKDWMMRLFGPDAALSGQIADVLEIQEHCSTLDEMDKLFRNWVHIQRNVLGIPKDIPICVAVDAYTKLLHPEEAELAVGNHMDKDGAVKGISEMSKKPAVFAAWMHTWINTITMEICDKSNVILILVSGQNQNMNAVASAFAADGGASLNKTRRGGTAINQSAAAQITVTSRGIMRDSKGNISGSMVRLRMVKNSYGPRDTELVYGLRTSNFVDTEGTYQQAIEMDEAFTQVLAEQKVLGITCNRRLYSSDELGVHAISPSKLMQLINSDQKVRTKVGRALGIQGYEAEL